MKKSVRRHLAVFLAGLSLTAGLGLWWLQARLGPAIAVAAESQSRLLAERLITQVAAQCAREGLLSYESLIQMSFDQTGRPVSLHTDSARLALLQGEFSARLQELLQDNRANRGQFPLGSVLGTDLFAGWGPTVTVRLATENTLTTQLEHQFSDGGINQTLHTLRLKVWGTLTVYLFSTRLSVDICTWVPVAETVIFGPVPNWYRP